MKTTEIKKQLEKATARLNAFLSEKPNATGRIIRLHLMVNRYEELLRNREPEQEYFFKQAV